MSFFIRRVIFCQYVTNRSDRFVTEFSAVFKKVKAQLNVEAIKEL